MRIQTEQHGLFGGTDNLTIIHVLKSQVIGEDIIDDNQMMCDKFTRNESSLGSGLLSILTTASSAEVQLSGSPSPDAI
jgi:hypothetical protein